jgi:2-iminobutanoate/2-iminopropanoate deaminase
MEKERKHYPDIAPTGPTHVRAVKFGNLMFTSGCTALGTPAQGGTLVEQSRATLGKIKRIVEREGCTMADIIKLTTYVISIAEYREHEGEVDAVWAQVFAGEYPANTLLEVSALAQEGLDIEIEVVLGF